MARILKVTTDDGGGIPQDTVECLLDKATAGEELVVFADDGSIIFIHDNHEFEAV